MKATCVGLTKFRSYRWRRSPYRPSASLLPAKNTRKRMDLQAKTICFRKNVFVFGVSQNENLPGGWVARAPQSLPPPECYDQAAPLQIGF